MTHNVRVSEPEGIFASAGGRERGVLVRVRVLHYGVALLSVALALGATLLLEPLLDSTTTPLFFAAVMVSAWYGGLGPGLVATALSTLFLNYFFIEPFHSLNITDVGTLLRLSVFMMAAVLISSLNESLRTAQRKAEANLKSLRESEARFCCLAESSIIGVIVADLNGSIVEANDAFLRMVGYTQEELRSGRVRWREMTPPEYLQVSEHSQEELRTTGFCKPFEKEYIRKDGSRVPVLLGSAMLGENTAIGFVLDLSDASWQAATRLRKQAEAQQRTCQAEEAQRILQILLEYVPEGITIATGPPDFPIVANSKLAQELLGKPNETLIGISSGNHVQSYGLFRSDGVTRHTREQLPLYRATRYGETISNEECIIERPDGSRITVLANVVPIRNLRGEIIGAINCWRDITERKQTEEALRKSEERLLLAQRAAKIGTWEWNLLIGEVSWSEGIWDLLGIEQGSEIPNLQLWTDCIHPDDREQAQRHMETALAEGEDYDDEFRIIRRDGTIRWVASKGRFVRSADGKAERMLGVNIDITERKQAEDERTLLLAKYANRLRKLAEASLIINSTLSLTERLRLITEQAREIIEAHQSVTSMTTDQNWAQAIHTVSLSDKYAQWRDYYEQPDGSGIYTLVCRMQSPIRMTQTELEAHPAWRRFGQAAGKHPPLRGWLAAPLTNRRGKNLGLIQLSDKYEGDFTPEDEAILVQLAQMASTAIDNAQLYEQSQQANRIKDEFLAVLSHELRSPLNAILGWSKLLRSGKLDSTQSVRALETIERNAKLQTQLIEDLLDVSRILRGKISLNVSPVNPVTPIEAAINTMRPAAEAKSIDLRFTILDFGWEDNSENPKSNSQKPKLLVLADLNRLQQVVWNLLSNAIKFTPVGGRVEVCLSVENGSSEIAHGARGMGQGTMEISNAQCPMPNAQFPIPYAQITVSDTGKGISADFLPHVFEYFRQADASITRTHGGLGLGLAIVRHLVELHGGTISAESPGEGQGATFTVRLPLMKQQPENNQENESLNNSVNLKGVKVLVVDDESDTREYLAFALEQYGAMTMTAASVAEALERLEQFQPDILVSDIGMPTEDGYTFIRRVRTLKREQRAKIPAIALTAYAGESDRHQALSAGFQKHLPKPIEPAELAAAVASLLG